MYINNDIDYVNYLKGKKIYIFGCGETGRKYAAKLKTYAIEAFIDNDKNKVGVLIDGIPVIEPESFEMKNDISAMIIICSKYEKEICEQLLSMGIFNHISCNQIDLGGAAEYYDDAYFRWQKEMGIFGAKKKIAYFSPYIKKEMTVVEFGSGGGYLLDKIEAKRKIGIEINDSARKEAETQGLECVKYTKELADETADLIISTSVLEHCENPFGELVELRKKLREGGMIVFHVPNESCDTEYQKSEINNHLYTWNCLNLGNLFKAAGFFVKSVEKLISEWPEHFMEVDDEISDVLFDSISKIKGSARKTSSCLIVAYKS